MRKKKKNSNIVSKYQSEEGGIPSTFSGDMMVVVGSLLYGDGHENQTTLRSLQNMLRITKKHKDMTIRTINGCFMVARESEGNFYEKENFPVAKNFLAEQIQKYWGLGIESKHLEPRRTQNWDNYCDIKLNFSVDSIPKIKRKERPTEEKSWEQRLGAGEFDFDLDVEEDGA